MKPGQNKDLFILGLLCFHDSSACLLRNGEIVAMAEEERFDREKHSHHFPKNAIQYCLDKAGINFSQIDCVAYGLKPWKYFFNQGYSAFKNLPKSLNLLRKGASDIPLKEKLANLLNVRGQIIRYFNVSPRRIIYIDHHTAHAYSTFFISPFKEAAVLVIDGFGESYTTSHYHGRADTIECLGSVPYPNSLGIYYAAITHYLGFRPLFDEYKVMGMAAYGENRHQAFFRKMLSINNNKMDFKLDTSYVGIYTHGVRKSYSEKMVKELGPQRNYIDPYQQRHFDIARSAQARLEEIAVYLGEKLKKKTGSDNLCLAGGCAQNVLMNRLLLDRCGFKNIFVPPVAYDGGVSLGSALAVYHKFFGGMRNFVLERADWGPRFSDEQCEKALREKGVSIAFKGEGAPARVAELLAGGKIVGFFDAGMEIGPRALGYRSILADPRRADMKDILNSRIKKREFFRPFAPIVPLEDCNEYFDLNVESPFMTIVGKVKKPELLPAITHQDGTARIQTVTKNSNPNIYGLLKKFGEITNIPVLINTSFNENEPIVCTPHEAIDCFLRTHMDSLVFNNKVIVKK